MPQDIALTNFFHKKGKTLTRVQLHSKCCRKVKINRFVVTAWYFISPKLGDKTIEMKDFNFSKCYKFFCLFKLMPYFNYFKEVKFIYTGLYKQL